MLRVLRGIAWSVFGGSAAGYVANRAAAFFADHPLTMGSSYNAADYASAFMVWPPRIDERFALVFWIFFGLVALFAACRRRSET